MNTCEICDTPDLCMEGLRPCDLCGEFIADVPVEKANELLAAYYKASGEKFFILRAIENWLLNLKEAQENQVAISILSILVMGLRNGDYRGYE